VNKSQLIDTLAARFEGNRRSAQHALESVLDTITREVAKGEKVAITGFGSFEKRVRAAGWARNPATGDRIRTKKKAVPKFSAGQDLKNVVSGAKKLPKLTSTASTTAKKATPAKSTSAKKTAAKKAPAKNTGTAKASTAKATTAKKASTTKATSARKAPAAKRTSATRTVTAKKAPANKTGTAKTSTAKTTTAKTTTAKKAPARKTTKKS